MTKKLCREILNNFEYKLIINFKCLYLILYLERN